MRRAQRRMKIGRGAKKKHKNFRQDEEMSCRNQEQPISNSRAEKHDPAQEQEKGVRATSVKKA